MTVERRYPEDEIREIFDRAANPAAVGRPDISDEGGLTLAELQDVGREAGMEPALIVQAAMAIDTRRETVRRQTVLGTPVSAGRVVELPRAPTDHEWDVLVGELRETFSARGVVTTHGGVREWSNGNLHVFMEPTATGYRLRMGTYKGGGAALLRGGATVLVIGLLLLTLFIGEGLPPAAAVAVLISLAGGATLIKNAVSLPRWAGEREDQMEHIAGRALALLTEGGE